MKAKINEDTMEAEKAAMMSGRPPCRRKKGGAPSYKRLLTLVGLVLCAFLMAGCVKGKNDETPPDQTPDDTTPANLCSSSNLAACLYQAEVNHACLPNDPSSLCTFEIAEIIDDTRVGGTRTIPVAAYLPPDPNPPFPVVLLSHGGAEGKTNPVQSLPDWAAPIVSAGYMVVGIAHVPRDEASRDALCEELGITDPGDCSTFKYLHYDRPYDVKKVLDWLEDPSNSMYPFADRERIALLGHSAGAGAAMMIAGASRTYVDEPVVNDDRRVGAFLAFSPQGPGNDGFDEHSWDAVNAPSLFGTGLGDISDDEPDAPASRRRPYELAASAEKYLLYINDAAAQHGVYTLDLGEPCSADTARCEEFRDWLVSVCLAFLDAVLRERGEAQQWLASDDIVTASGGDAEWHRP